MCFIAVDRSFQSITQNINSGESIEVFQNLLSGRVAAGVFVSGYKSAATVGRAVAGVEISRLRIIETRLFISLVGGKLLANVVRFIT